jgi:hypothetical protein
MPALTVYSTCAFYEELHKRIVAEHYWGDKLQHDEVVDGSQDLMWCFDNNP